MNIRFDDKVVLITGVAPHGLGAAYAELLADRGTTLVLNDLGVDWSGESTPPGAEIVARQISEAGGSASAVGGDVSEDAQRIVAETVERHGRIDALINNAGAGGDFDTMLRVHVKGTHQMSEAAWPWLQKAGAGRIINTASNATWGSGSNGRPGYATAKSAVIALTRVQARNGQADGIASNVVLPSAWTNSTAGMPDPAVRGFLERHFAAEHIAGFVAYLAHESATVTGMAFSAGGGVVARVVQAKTHGHLSLEASPEVWAEHIDEVTEIGDLLVPPSMWGDVGMLARRIGPEVAGEFETLDLPI